MVSSRADIENMWLPDHRAVWHGTTRATPRGQSPLVFKRAPYFWAKFHLFKLDNQKAIILRIK